MVSSAGEEQFVFFDNGFGHRLAATVHRAGESCDSVALLIHGETGCRASAHRLYVKAARRLAVRGINCLRFDLRNRGDSIGPPGPIRLIDEVNDALSALEYAVNEMGAGKIVLIGISKGGAVSLISAYSTEIVRGVVAISTPFFEPVMSKRFSLEIKLHAVARDAAALRFEALGRRLSKLPGMIRGAVARPAGGPSPERAAAGGEKDVSRGSTGVFIDRMKSVVAGSRRARPVLFVFGGDDPLGPPSARRYRRWMRDGASPESGVIVIAGCDHGFSSGRFEQRLFDEIEAFCGRVLEPGLGGHA